MIQQLFSKTGLLILALCTLLVTLAMSHSLQGVRVDLTENRLYTLSENTQHLLRELPQSVTLELFYSGRQISDAPHGRNYARRVIGLLEEYVAASRGRLTLNVLDPAPLSEAEDQAIDYGLQRRPFGVSGQTAYFGLVAVNDENPNQWKMISFLHPERERLLEYDISQLIVSITESGKPKMMSRWEGNEDLVSRQTGGRFARPFTKVVTLEREALLKQRLLEVEPALQPLQGDKKKTDDQRLNPEQSTVLERVTAEKLNISQALRKELRKELRNVRYQLNKEVEQLAVQLKLINILAVPVFLIFLALIVHLFRRRL